VDWLQPYIHGGSAAFAIPAFTGKALAQAVSIA
jgi:hypothetical protein